MPPPLNANFFRRKREWEILIVTLVKLLIMFSFTARTRWRALFSPNSLYLGLTLLWWLSRMGALFFITTNQCFSTVSAAELFISERKLFVYVLRQNSHRSLQYRSREMNESVKCLAGTSTSAATTGYRSTSCLRSCPTSPCAPSPHWSSASLSILLLVMPGPVSFFFLS